MRVGIIGMGAMGSNHYRVLKSISKVEVVAVCDSQVDPPVPERTYRSATAMLDSEDLQAVIVAVPSHMHFEIASEVICRRVPLLVEKPVASTVEQAMRLIELAALHDTRVAVGHVERFNPVVRSLITELREKEIYSISITRIGPFPPRITDVGVLVDLSVHDIDLVYRLTGCTDLIEARILKSTKLIGNREDNAVITMRLANDVIASITTNWLTPFKKRTIEVATDHAFYSADLISQELVEYSSYSANNSYLVRHCGVKKGEPLLGEIHAFLTFAEDGRRDGLASLEDGMRTLQAITRTRADNGSEIAASNHIIQGALAGHG